jgi:hypothetical protein
MLVAAARRGISATSPPSLQEMAGIAYKIVIQGRRTGHDRRGRGHSRSSFVSLSQALPDQVGKSEGPWLCGQNRCKIPADLPTISEGRPGLRVLLWWGRTPGRTRSRSSDKLITELAAIMKTPTM